MRSFIRAVFSLKSYTLAVIYLAGLFALTGAVLVAGAQEPGEPTGPRDDENVRASGAGFLSWVRQVSKITPVRLGVEVCVADHAAIDRLSLPVPDPEWDVARVLKVFEEISDKDKDKLLLVSQHDKTSIRIKTRSLGEVERNPLDHQVDEFHFKGTMQEFGERLREIFPEVGPAFEQPVEQLSNEVVEFSLTEPVTIRSIIDEYCELSGSSWLVFVGAAPRPIQIVDVRTNELVVETFESRTTIYIFPRKSPPQTRPTVPQKLKDADRV